MNSRTPKDEPDAQDLANLATFADLYDRSTAELAAECVRRGGAYLATAVKPGDRTITLDREIGPAGMVRIGQNQPASYESILVDRDQEFPARVIRLAGELRFRYPAGASVEPIDP